jgi:hypothetical protein
MDSQIKQAKNHTSSSLPVSKKQYSKPGLKMYGKIKNLTAGGNMGNTEMNAGQANKFS